jgi:hypothetical protein
MGTVDRHANLKSVLVRLAVHVLVEATSRAADRQAGFTVGVACNSCQWKAPEDV